MMLISVSKLLSRITCSSRKMMKLNGYSKNYSQSGKSYEEAIKALNSLQSNQQELNSSIKLKELKHTDENLNLVETEKFLLRTGLTWDHLDRLSVIHVAGTKGKGSTCNYTDSILRSHHVKTGLFTSPHLISVTERIQLSGKIISKELFCSYFWEIYNLLQSDKDHDKDMPSYFKFLTIMAFYIFIKEKVDVAVIEVGIGGEYDSTNILRNTDVVGITSLHLEHTSLLGSTLEEIAWQKAGIIKPNSKVFVMPQQDVCMSVIESRAAEKQTNVHHIPAFDSIEWKNCLIPDLSNTSDVNKLNVSMAIQLAGHWLIKYQHKLGDLVGVKENNDGLIYTVDQRFLDGILRSDLAGRFQKIEKEGVRFYLDGAHTKESVELCAEWFKNQAKDETTQKFLIYNSIGDRNSEEMLRILHPLNFNKVFFTTNSPTIVAMKNRKDDNFHRLSRNIQLERCQKHQKIWENFSKEILTQRKNESFVFETIEQALNSIKELKNTTNCNVLITGSLHLVGATLGILESEICS